jgi:hypothetical protein
MATTPVVLHVYDTGSAVLLVDAPVAGQPTMISGHQRAWRKAHRMSREMGWRGAVRVFRHFTFAGDAREWRRGFAGLAQ